MKAVSIPAGQLQRRVVVWRLKEGITPDAAGHVDETDESNWRIVGNRWVKLTPKGSKEFFRGQQVAEDITHQVTMRYDSESAKFTTKDRLTYHGRVFNMAGPGVNTDEMDVLLTFPATEIK